MDNTWKHKEIYPVRAFELDRSNSAPLQTLCNYMEDAAGKHADKLGLSIDRMQSLGLTWVMARLQIELFRQPAEGENVRLATWPVEMQRLQFRRDFLLEDDAGQPIAKAISQWVIVNMQTRRVERIPDFVSNHRPEDPEKVMEECDWRMAPQAESPVRGLFRVRLSDIDRNRHVNNVRLIDWVIESAPPALEGGQLRRLELVFRTEGLYGDTVLARTGAGDAPGEFIHGLFREADGQELLKARSVWA